MNKLYFLYVSIMVKIIVKNNFKRKMQDLSMAYRFNYNINKKQLYVLSIQKYKSNKIDCRDIHQTHYNVNYVTCAGIEGVGKSTRM